MTMRILWAITVLFLIAGTGCDEEKGPAYAFGEGYINPPNASSMMNGTLGTSGNQDLYGGCKYSDGQFSFEVGHEDVYHLDEVDVANAMYFKFTGIVGPEGGPPVEGVFSEAVDDAGNPVPKSGVEYQSTFGTATVASMETFSFSATEGACRVQLFAKAIEGELVPNFNKSFEYYVKLDCTGMSDVQGSTGADLQSVNVEFYFDNCN